MSEDFIATSPYHVDIVEEWYDQPHEPDEVIDDEISICCKQSADKFLFCKYYNRPYWVIQFNGYKWRGTLTIPEELGIINYAKNLKSYIMFQNVHHEIETAIDYEQPYLHLPSLQREKKAALSLVRTKKHLLKAKFKRRQHVLNKHIVYDAAECLWAYEFSMSKFLSQDIKREIISYLTK
jgi:hypothetical protein